MRLTHLEVTDHRNIAHAELHPDPHLTVLCGPNGQGKTNLLEAIWLLTGGKSFRGSKDAELIRRGCDFSVIEGAFETQDVEKSIRLTVGSRQSQRPGRTGKLNGADVGRAAALAGNFQAVVFEPDLLGLVKGGPDGRRRFMDSALCQVYRPYLVALRRYMRLTAQKNALLKSYDITPNGNMLLDTYDEQLAEYGALIMEHRCKFLAAAAPIAAQNYKDISHGAEVLTLNYQMCTAAPTAAALTEQMRAMRRAELLRDLVAHRVRRRRPRRQNRHTGFIRRVQHLILRLAVALQIRRQVVQQPLQNLHGSASSLETQLHSLLL